jgi:hypothetical protein
MTSAHAPLAESAVTAAISARPISLDSLALEIAFFMKRKPPQI